ncbi:unnamed protein product [Protopolystoma xenopodis]|uniref:Uncharacterized protein n=1 Tax=Protopolystoma xenopodis TaxID=117903 RepID=A0A448WVI5_9PLAT|nr:unnamed protein product [Protopolystoma xenopodis]
MRLYLADSSIINHFVCFVSPGPGRPAHNAQPLTCSGDPIDPNELALREALRAEKRRQKLEERQFRLESKRCRQQQSSSCQHNRCPSTQLSQHQHHHQQEQQQEQKQQQQQPHLLAFQYHSQQYPPSHALSEGPPLSFDGQADLFSHFRVPAHLAYQAKPAHCHTTHQMLSPQARQPITGQILPQLSSSCSPPPISAGLHRFGSQEGVNNPGIPCTGYLDPSQMIATPATPDSEFVDLHPQVGQSPLPPLIYTNVYIHIYLFIQNVRNKMVWSQSPFDSKLRPTKSP